MYILHNVHSVHTVEHTLGNAIVVFTAVYNGLYSVYVCCNMQYALCIEPELNYVGHFTVHCVHYVHYDMRTVYCVKRSKLQGKLRHCALCTAYFLV